MIWKYAYVLDSDFVSLYVEMGVVYISAVNYSVELESFVMKWIDCVYERAAVACSLCRCCSDVEWQLLLHVLVASLVGLLCCWSSFELAQNL